MDNKQVQLITVELGSRTKTNYQKEVEVLEKYPEYVDELITILHAELNEVLSCCPNEPEANPYFETISYAAVINNPDLPLKLQREGKICEMQMRALNNWFIGYTHLFGLSF